MTKEPQLLPLIVVFFFFRPSIAVDFVFNGFDPSNITLYGNSSLESGILDITNDTTFSIGRALYKSKIPTRSPISSSLLPFSSSFIFSIARYQDYLPGHGLVFLFTPVSGIRGASSAQHLGLFNRTNNGDPKNRVFAVEFDVFENEEFGDMDANHVGIDVNSLTSVKAHTAGFWPDGATGDSFTDLGLNNGVNYQAWIDYSDDHLNVTMARAGMRKPKRPLLSVDLDLSKVFLDEMYVGFCAATGRLVESHRILAWSFSNSNFTASEGLITRNLPSFVQAKASQSKGLIAGVSVAVAFVLILVAAISLFWNKKKKQRKSRERQELEDWELEYWPHRIGFQEINKATSGFTEENLIGVGGSGKVYKGVLCGGVEVAVKCLLQESLEGTREFLAEVSSLGRLKHRNLVGLRGWCKGERGSLVLVYEFMENGSLDKRVFECSEEVLLSWESRVRVLKDVAAGVLYLHEGWESRVLHRDIKASNVLLDREMTAKLGDFGLARLHGHGQVSSTTRVVGTVGYMAPEVVRSGKASAQTDVFGFGILVLEVCCGRRPVEEGQAGLVDWVWGLMEKNELVSALDPRLSAEGGFDVEEVERVLHLGLLCAYPDHKARPTMRQVAQVLEGRGDLDESIGGESVDAYLLDKLISSSMWSKYHGSVYGSHPTFDELQQSMPCSTSLSSSDIIAVGR